MSRRASGVAWEFCKGENYFPVRLLEAFALPVPRAVPRQAALGLQQLHRRSLLARNEEVREMKGHGAEREPGEEAPTPVFRVRPVSRMLRAEGGRGRRGNSSCAANPALVT